MYQILSKKNINYQNQFHEYHNIDLTFHDGGTDEK